MGYYFTITSPIQTKYAKMFPIPKIIGRKLKTKADAKFFVFIRTPSRIRNNPDTNTTILLIVINVSIIYPFYKTPK